ncbi:Structural maintenance of chromosomes protein 6B [Vitis vinifera]|uniref:Structural maintenance of chromosomes protein 6B n=1 Tax=Vitis vinifera TaxID=29760 RepID=A0A438DV23_VITVI|nr:Structural maintenance of chromosomes protein 6B [Vitis vinifera]
MSQNHLGNGHSRFMGVGGVCCDQAGAVIRAFSKHAGLCLAIKAEMLALESCRKASIICPESEIEALGGCKSTPEQLSAQLNRLNQRLQSESQRYAEPIEDLRMIYDKKERRILRKQQTYEAFREKLNVSTT